MPKKKTDRIIISFHINKLIKIAIGIKLAMNYEYKRRIAFCIC